jgi:hypothetical protein
MFRSVPSVPSTRGGTDMYVAHDDWGKRQCLLCRVISMLVTSATAPNTGPVLDDFPIIDVQFVLRKPARGIRLGQTF